jgi:circadian clock protein KaiB
MTTPADAAIHQSEGDLGEDGAAFYELTLFVSGASDLAARAITNARRLCDTYLAGRYRLAVVDVYEDVAAFVANDVLATPTLMRSSPLPVRKVVGDLSRTDKVLRALDLPEAADVASTLRP